MLFRSDNSSETTIITAFEIALNITAIFPCLTLIIIYLILKKELKYTHYFKLELMFILLIIISLNFALIKFNKSESKSESESESKSPKPLIITIKEYLEIVLSLFFLSFSYLCYSLSKAKNKESSKSLIISLSLGSLVFPIYRIIIYKNDNNSYYFIVNICVISFIYLLDLIKNFIIKI